MELKFRLEENDGIGSLHMKSVLPSILTQPSISSRDPDKSPPLLLT